ncbi:lipid-A-disaccharide synthase [Neosynechococcus sphagnicola]|uniref:lipid-A-disaccharide synthase n=1 Tax=Neosynechococcus sphagnicola TaxID=1501145 RepID=UPI001EF9E8F0|nr:lipid-A-disaccharide synthase [Neosynechococcus sphagnicola]
MNGSVLEKPVPAVDILILANGPGELATWVKPTVQALRQTLGTDPTQVRISLMLSPCPHATGQEVPMARGYPEIDRVQAADHFWGFLLWGQTPEAWDWRDRGVVVFLGGDQIFPVLIGRRLGYRTVVYAEWDARWPAWIDAFGVMKPDLIKRVPPQYAHKLQVVGDLIAEVATLATAPHQPDIAQALDLRPDSELIGLLPGSKAAKLTQGMPLVLAIAHHLQTLRPQTRFVIPVAPTLDLKTLASFANPNSNVCIQRMGGIAAKLVTPAAPRERPYLETPTGLRVTLWTDFPHYSLLRQCHLCLTTVGANTAELGSLGVPMIVLLPTQQLDAMRAWDGLPGLLANLPGVGTLFARLINRVAMGRLGLLAWPNIWAGEAIVPELLGQLQPTAIADQVFDLLCHPTQLHQMQQRLQQVRGAPGAAPKLAQLVKAQLEATSPISGLRGQR